QLHVDLRLPDDARWDHVDDGAQLDRVHGVLVAFAVLPEGDGPAVDEVPSFRARPRDGLHLNRERTQVVLDADPGPPRFEARIRDGRGQDLESVERRFRDHELARFLLEGLDPNPEAQVVLRGGFGAVYEDLGVQGGLRVTGSRRVGRV